MDTRPKLSALSVRYTVITTLIVAFAAVVVALIGATKASAETRIHTSGYTGYVNTPYSRFDGDYGSLTNDGVVRWGGTRVCRAGGAYYNRPQTADVRYYVDRWNPDTGSWEDYWNGRNYKYLGNNSCVDVGGQNNYTLRNWGDYYRTEIWVRWRYGGISGNVIGVRGYREDQASDYICDDYVGNDTGGECQIFDGYVRLTSN